MTEDDTRQAQKVPYHSAADARRKMVSTQVLGYAGRQANRPLILAAWADGLAIGFCAFPFVRIRGSRCRAYGALGGAAPLVLNNRSSVAVCKGNGVSRVTVSVADFIYNEMNSAVCRGSIRPTRDQTRDSKKEAEPCLL